MRLRKIPFSAFLPIFIMGFVLMCAPLSAHADYLGQKVEFSVNPQYDAHQRTQVPGILVVEGQHGYFYVDDDWWTSLNFSDQAKIKNSINILSAAFDNTIYPDVTAAYGSEWNPGIDNKREVTVFIDPLAGDRQGYFSSANEYPNTQVPTSNEREMVYLNANMVNSPYLESFLAHELTHLITFNQKDRLEGVPESVWLNELRAEYAPTIAGYDTPYANSYLQNRVTDFLLHPSTPLIDWRGTLADYGTVSLFGHYLVQQYGIGVLQDSLHSNTAGISSIEAALSEEGHTVTFSDVFENWLIADYVNNCALGTQYCYSSGGLQSLQVVPKTNFLPLSGQSTLRITETTEPWTARWYKFVGGQGDLNLQFQGAAAASFQVPYIAQHADNSYSLGTLNVQQGYAELQVQNFGTEITSIVLMPFVASSNEADAQQYTFTITASTQGTGSVASGGTGGNNSNAAQLKARIADLQALIAQLQAELQNNSSGSSACGSFQANLSIGSTGEAVRCLQEALNQFSGTQVAATGPGSPGNETAYFGPLTKAAVIRFQEQYAVSVLQPLGLKQGTGFVGPSTRAKLNELESSSS